MKKLLLSLLTVLFATLNAQAQDCPRIFLRGDTLYTDPAPQYQWFNDNQAIPSATKQWYLPTKKGIFSVEVSGTTNVLNYTLPTVDKTITGRIVDERYEPIADAMISVGINNVKSDAQGRFTLPGLEKTETAVVTITKAGFWKNTQRVHFFNQDTAALTAMLEPLKVTNRFDAQKGATISERGFFLTFPPNSAVTEDGKTYTSTINISLKRSFPAEDGFGLRMPGGDFSAIDQNGQEKMLVSYGFMSAEMQGANGEKLKFASDKEATLEFYIPWEENKSAPDSMPLWHFDETNAVWKPEDIARKVGPRYVGTVKHFSSWNCDVPKNRATVKGKTRNCKGYPIPNVVISVGQRVVTADVNGEYTAFVPSDMEFKVTASVDTIIVAPLMENEEREVKDLEKNAVVLQAVGLIDTTGKLTVYGDGVKSYSVDGGKVYHVKGKRITFLENEPSNGIARDAEGCKMNFHIRRILRPSDCQLLDSTDLAHKPTFNTIADALFSHEEVFRLKPNESEINFSLLTSTFPCLHYLMIESGRVGRLPESFGQLASLQTLGITGRGFLRTLPESFGQLYNLQTLYLHDNALTSLPESFGQLYNLQTLYLQRNRLTNLPESFGQLNNLKILYLEGNQLTNLPESFGQFLKLRSLSLSANALITLPESLGQLTNLRRMDLKMNHLIAINESFGQLINLQSLDLSSNNLTTLPATITNLKDSLSTLDLRGNPISEEELAKIRSWLPKTTIYF